MIKNKYVDSLFLKKSTKFPIKYEKLVHIYILYKIEQENYTYF